MWVSGRIVQADQSVATRGVVAHGGRALVIKAWSTRTIADTPLSGVIIKVAGLTGRNRGMKSKRPGRPYGAAGAGRADRTGSRVKRICYSLASWLLKHKRPPFAPHNSPPSGWQTPPAKDRLGDSASE